MATSRVMYDNYLTSLNPTVTLFASGGAVAQSTATVSGVQPVKVGYANHGVQGTYTRAIDTFYRIQIHSAGSGAFGSAQWRWTDDPHADPIVWNASGLTTQNGTFVTLNHGVQWRFLANGSFTPQFAINDYWDFAVTLRNGYQKGLDLYRDHEYRSGTMPTSSTIEHRYQFASGIQPTGFALMDHNIPSLGVTTLKLKNGAFTDPPTVTITIPWNSGRMAALLTPSAFTHWRICVTLSSVSLPYLRWSNVFLGSSLVFEKTFSTGFQDASEWLGAADIDTLRRGPGRRQLEGRMLQLTYPRMKVADQAKLRTLRAWINDPAYEVMRPFYFLLLDSDLTNFILCNWTNGYIKDHRHLDQYDDPIELTEIVRSIA